ncbi:MULTISPECIES: hypothetical protein [unclassified Pedobacter]|uniref:hypothetical protein n=1 Tax=unclassified Pedobacter TaxID=2628915 RepID=UPI000B4B7661|nr:MULTISPECIES: hypothetical protein [unclassified Pedobacter]MCX2429505.1 hypothetical protein [Pedobacter sp. GR22-10]OWK70866.1 hypothetical protein CBW18_07165 [Pedobacter sp. AJM]
MKSISKTSFLIVFFLLLSHYGYTQPIGCQPLNSTEIYTSNVLGIWGGTPLLPTCGPTSTITTQYAANVRIRPNRGCNINILGAGNEVYYNVAYCPLDDYLVYFGCGLGVLGFRMLSRRLA